MRNFVDDFDSRIALKFFNYRSIKVIGHGWRVEMFDIWEVVEELAATAYEHGTKTISMSQIGKELKDAKQNNIRNVQEVRKTLVELGYSVVV
jgi:hypothetical protein